MEEVIHYLELKNQYYEKFHSMTCNFLAQANRNQWDGIEFFVDNRERILNIIHSFDFKIAKLFEQIDMSQCDLELYRARVKGCLDKRAEWANKIVALDLELIARMEEIRTETIRDLKKTVEQSQQLNAFTVSPAPRKFKATKEV